MEDIIRTGEADLYNYACENERLFVILSYICRLGVLNDSYKYIIESFFASLPYGSFDGMMNRCEIFIILLSKKFADFYNTYAYINDTAIIEFFWSMDLSEYQSLITTSAKFGVDFFYTEYREVVLEAIETAIVAYMEDIDPDDYYVEYDMGDLLSQNMKFNGYYEELDRETVVKTICEWVKEDVEEVVSEMIAELPQDILDNIKIQKEKININEADVDSFVESYLEPSEPEYDHHENDYEYGGTSEMSILDGIFK